MPQTAANLSSARKELAKRKDEAAQCMAELKAAQELVAAGGSGAKTLTVTVKEIFGDIAVDRVSIRPDKTNAQEKVVSQGIPCDFSLGAEVTTFDLVIMAEHSSDDGAAVAADKKVDKERASTPAAQPAEDGEADKVLVEVIAAAAEGGTDGTGATDKDVADSTGAAQPSGEGAPTTAAESDESSADRVADKVADGAAASTQDAVAEETEPAEDSTKAGAAAPSAEGGAATEEDKEEAKDAEAGAASGGAAPVANGATASNGEEGGLASSPVSSAPSAGASGCSTVTTELVVPSTELDFTSTRGQWRYLGADSEPPPGDDAVEVTKGVRFSTSLEGQNAKEDEARIMELTHKYEEAGNRVRSAEAMVKKLQPATSGTVGRKKSATSSGNRKSALKKGKAGTRSSKADAGKGKGAVGALTSVFGGLYGGAKRAGALAWGSRNLMFFVSAIAVIHLRGDYLAV